jgi:hypothetical protein
MVGANPIVGTKHNIKNQPILCGRSIQQAAKRHGWFPL